MSDEKLVQGGSHAPERTPSDNRVDAVPATDGTGDSSVLVSSLAEAVASSPLQTASELILREDCTVFISFGGYTITMVEDELSDAIFAEESLNLLLGKWAASKTAEILKERDALREELMREKKRVCIGGDIFETGRNELILHQQTELDYLQRAEKAESELQSAQQTIRDLTEKLKSSDDQFTSSTESIYDLNVTIQRLQGALESVTQSGTVDVGPMFEDGPNGLIICKETMDKCAAIESSDAPMCLGELPLYFTDIERDIPCDGKLIYLANYWYWHPKGKLDATICTRHSQIIIRMGKSYLKEQIFKALASDTQQTQDRK